MRLKKEQKEALLEWVAAGLETGEINQKAAASDQPFQVSRAQVDYYRKTRKVDLRELASSAEYDALSSGLALRSERVKRLTLLAALMEEDIFNGVLWTENVKMIGSGDAQERIEFEEFNSAEVVAYRGVLDDIAAEMGDRRANSVNVNLDIDVASLTDEQLEQLANGEDPRKVMRG